MLFSRYSNRLKFVMVCKFIACSKSIYIVFLPSVWAVHNDDEHSDDDVTD